MDLSIIIPVYNVEDYLSDCLESVYKISGIEKEIIIVNDGSTDNSQDVIEYYSKKYSSITKVIIQENRGLSGARNSGIKVATGEYISFIDSDDFLDPDKYSDLFERGKKLDLDIIFGDLKYNRDSKCYITKNIEARSKKLSNLPVCGGLEFWEKCLDESNDSIRVEVVTNIYKRSLLVDNKILFRENLLHEDTLFMFIVTYYAKRVKYFPMFFYYYRLREGSIMNKLGLKNYVHKLFIAQELGQFKDEHNVSSKSWDTVIVALYFGSIKSYQISNRNAYKKVKNTSKLTRLSKFKRKIIPIYHIISKEVDIGIN